MFARVCANATRNEPSNVAKYREEFRVPSSASRRTPRRCGFFSISEVAWLDNFSWSTINIS